FAAGVKRLGWAGVCRHGNGGPVRRVSTKISPSQGPPLRAQSVISSAVVAITRTIMVAPGVLAPGHLGELTRVVPFELVDCLVDDARARERRSRLLPSRTGVYFLLAMCLFPRAGYLGVWGKLTAALDGLGPGVPSAKALR